MISRACAILLTLLPATGWAQHELSVYGGIQGALSSDMDGRDVNGQPLSFDVDWEGRSLDMPPYYGLRYTWWRRPQWGLTLDFTHVKLYADDASLDRSGFETLEFTDGLNVATIGATRRFDPVSGVVPHAGFGVGFVYPHVETRSPQSQDRTYEYQFGGLAAAARFGVTYPLSDHWHLFGEYEANYVRLDVDMNGGGSLRSDIVTNALNLGLTWRFGP
ncbi:outer membrane protein [Amaricoccus tamworthensis]|uniref:outer membrane protein n=1 Tax=Amaricoccus tamworthensis TaxID=57002 RepID=UPI003C7D8B9C